MQKEYSTFAVKVLNQAKSAAKSLRCSFIGPEHILLALTMVEDTVPFQILKQYAVTEENIRNAILEYTAAGIGDNRSKTDYSPQAEELLRQAEEYAQRFHSETVGTEHLFLGCLLDPDMLSFKLLVTLRVNVDGMIMDLLVNIGENPQEHRDFLRSVRGHIGSAASDRISTPMLNQFGRDLTTEAREGKLDPVIGRKEEIERMLQILCRRTKNNPCVIGEPGVGKTAIVEAMAARLSANAVPGILKGKRLIMLDLSGMVAGTKYRGEFEERVHRLLEEIRACGDVILFIDEIHTIVGSGNAEGSMDASNLMKPALARGEIQVIGATTIAEYRKHIEKDAALERRFQPIMVEEPSEQECRMILEGLKERYETHHCVKITQEAINAAVTLSKRYISDRYLPDKAIDLLDEAAAKVNISQGISSGMEEEFEKQWKLLEKQKEEEIRNGAFHRIPELDKEQDKIEKKRQKYLAKLYSGQERPLVTEEDVRLVVSQWTKIEVTKLREKEAERLAKLETLLHKRVIGQEEAVEAVAKAVRRGRAGLKSPKRPIGSFLFLGPTGVGKTELSKALAEAVFGSEDDMIRIDMSEYMEQHSVSKMIGSPPGYVGFENGGQLSEKVRRKPYSVVLFDEIEKAHPDVFQILLQVLDDGHITDSQGRKIDFKNTIIIMTSNAGAQRIMAPKNLGFSSRKDENKVEYENMKKGVQEEIKRIFKPEFLNRIDETIVFHMLTKEELKQITGLLTSELCARAREQMNITLKFTPAARELLADIRGEEKFGARPLRRKLQTMVEDVLAEKILTGEIKPGSAVTVSVEKGKLKIANVV